MECLTPPLRVVPGGDWYCPVCEPIVAAQHRVIISEESDTSTVVVDLEISSYSSSSSDSEDGSMTFGPRRKSRREGAQLQILQISSVSESESELGEEDDSDSGPQRKSRREGAQLQIPQISSVSESESELGEEDDTDSGPRRKSHRMGAQLQTQQISSISESESELGKEDDSDSGPHITRSGYKRSGRLQILTEESSESEKGDDPLISRLAVVRKRRKGRRINPPRAVLESDSEVDVLAYPAASTRVPRCSRQGTANLPKTNGYCGSSSSSRENREISAVGTRVPGFTRDESSREVVEEADTQLMARERKRHNETTRKLRCCVAVDVPRVVVLPGSKGKGPSGSGSRSQFSTSASARDGKPERRAKRTRAASSRGQDANQTVTVASSNPSDDDDRTSICSGYCPLTARSSPIVLHQTDSDSEYVPCETPGSSRNRRVLRPRHPRRRGTATDGGVPLLEGLSDDFEEDITGETNDETYSTHVSSKPASKGKGKRKGKGKSVSKGKGKQRRRRRRRKRRRRKVRTKKQDPFTVFTPIRTRARTAATHGPSPRESLFRRAVIESHQHENISEGLQRARAVLSLRQRREEELLQRTPSFRSGATATSFGSTSANGVIATPQSGYRSPLSLFSVSSSAKKSDLRCSRAGVASTLMSSYGRLVGSLGQFGRASHSRRTDEVINSVPAPKRKLSMEISGGHCLPCAGKPEEKSPQS